MTHDIKASSEGVQATHYTLYQCTDSSLINVGRGDNLLASSELSCNRHQSSTAHYEKFQSYTRTLTNLSEFSTTDAFLLYGEGVLAQFLCV